MEALCRSQSITMVSLEPLCPACGGGMDVQAHDEVEHIWVEQEGYWDSLVIAEVFVLICPWCGKGLQTREVAWREREKEEG